MVAQRKLFLSGRFGSSKDVTETVNLDPEDSVERLVADALERDLATPYIGSIRFVRATDAIKQRGRNLAATLAKLCSRNETLSISSADSINLVGSACLFDQMWETLIIRDDNEPWSINKPVVRVVAGANPYKDVSRRRGPLHVVVVSSRLDWRNDIPPRRITRTLRNLQASGESIGIGVVAPAFPNEIRASLTPLSELGETYSGTQVLHIDAHGVLLSYEQFLSRYSEARFEFESKSWGHRVAPYQGLKSFILVNWIDQKGCLLPFPIHGKELGSLCREAGISLVVLNACRAASGAAEGGIAVELLEAGVPDVIAFRHKVSADSAAVFVTALYTALANGVVDSGSMLL